jgi:AcrR family transcriptional regulator
VLYTKLSPGPGKPAPKVAAHQRARLHSAMVDLVGEQGYSAVTVRALTRRAGVSSRAFYELYTSKEDCFLQTYDRVVRRAVKRIVTAQAGERDWRKRLRLAFDAFVRELEREPKAARLALIEVHGVGREALDQVRHVEAMFEAMFAESFSRAPGGIAIPPLLIKGIVAGTARVARARLLEPRAEDLTGLGEDLAEWCLSYYSDAVASLSELGNQTLQYNGVVGSSLSPSSNAEGSARSSIDDRALILMAVAKLVVASGSDNLTMSEIRTATGVTRGALKGHFSGVEECIAAARELEARRAFAHAQMHTASVDSSVSRVYHNLTHFCLQLASDPALARLCFLGTATSGSKRMRSRERIVTEMTSLVSVSPSGSNRASDLDLEASMGAVWGVLDHTIEAGPPTHLTRNVPLLVFLALAAQIGAQGAVEAIQGA